MAAGAPAAAAVPVSVNGDVSASAGAEQGKKYIYETKEEAKEAMKQLFKDKVRNSRRFGWVGWRHEDVWTDWYCFR